MDVKTPRFFQIHHVNVNVFREQARSYIGYAFRQ